MTPGQRKAMWREVAIYVALCFLVPCIVAVTM
jgi:hypothetical protein